MPVQITILSGARQGECLELTENAFEAGDRKGDAIYFDAVANPRVKGRRALLRLEEEGWRIRSAGTLPILLNHEPVLAPRPLRSGDIVRMSDQGPDFSFTLISRLTLAAEPPPVEPDKLPAGGTATAAIPGDHDLVSPRQRPFGAALLSLGALSLILAASVFLLRPSAPHTPRQSPTLKFAHIPALSVNEGEPLLWTPELIASESLGGKLTFSHDGPAPAGLQINSDTGTIRWTPTEAQGPGDYKCVLRVTATGSSSLLTASGTVFIQVHEINQPPVIATLPSPIVNLLEDRKLSLTIQASDPDLPAQKITYRLGSDAPSDMQLDRQSGQITWEADASYANRELAVAIHVSDDASNPLTTSATLRIRVIAPDPWEVAESRVRDAVYLIAARTTRANSLVPLGTACAIREDTLLTSATVAAAAEAARKNDWTIMALTSTELKSAEPQGLAITDTKAHVGYVQTQSPEQQSYFDLALLTTRDKLPATCQLASAADKLVNGEQLAGLGFTISGGALTRFDRPEPAAHKLELYSVIPFEPGAAGELLLLQLRGELPEHLFGSPIINDAGEVLGVYAFEGALPPGQNSPPIHYAPVVTLVKAWLSGEGRDHWVTPPPVAPADDSIAIP
ncbi:MAG: putative Ig domain-containing protein [Pirellulaceae bacterium]